MSLQEQAHEQFLDGVRVVADLVIARRLADRPMLQPVQRRLAGERSAVRPLRCQALRQQGQHRIVTQRVVIIHVLISQSDRRNPLCNQGAHAVNGAIRIAPVDEAIRKPVEEPNRFVSMAQQYSAGIGRDGSTVESGDHFASVEAFKF